VDALFRLQQRHVERVPYETLWIHLGQRWGIDPRRSARRIATTDRGGYCFHLNGALSELLVILGYRVTRHVGAVHGPAGLMEEEVGNHLVLVVHDLPARDRSVWTWYVDAGLGDATYEPIPLQPGSWVQGPYHLTLDRTEPAHWQLTPEPAASFGGMRWDSSPAEMTAFSGQHLRLSTSPNSGFVQVLTAQRRDATGADILRGLVFRRVGQGENEETIETKSRLLEVLGDVFGLDLSNRPAAAVERLWARVQARHLEWEAAGRPRRL